VIDFMTIDLDDCRARFKALASSDVEPHVHESLEEVIASLERLRAEVVTLRGERAAVVAWIRIEESHYPVGHAPLNTADAIERGEHRREETE
jgi:hypothetical protein